MMENGLKIRGCIKKNVFLIVCLLCGMSAYGQNWNYGIEIGYTNSRFHAHDPDVSCGHGFKVGGMVDYTFRNNILIETGLSYERKSGKIQGGPLANYGISEIDVRDMDYLVFPVSFGYTFNLCKDLVFIPQVGGISVPDFGAPDFYPEKTVSASPTPRPLMSFRLLMTANTAPSTGLTRVHSLA